MQRHAGEGETIAEAIRDCLDYGKNPEKTESGKYISAYECDPATVADEFLLAKASYAAMTGREQKKAKELLNSLIAEAETKCREFQENLEAAQAAYDEGQAVMASLNTQYNDIISWAEMYDTASIEAKKMIVSCLIKRVEVYRDYKLHIDFNIDFTQFCEGLDIVTIAA